MSSKFFVQCRMRKFIVRENVKDYESNKNFKYRVGWIPERFAQKGRVLKLKIDGKWDNGWKVIDTWQKRTKEEITERSQDYRHTRRFSDI